MKKIICTVLSVVMMLSVLFTPAFATDREDCEKDSKCSIYEGGEISTKFKRIIIPDEKLKEYSKNYDGLSSKMMDRESTVGLVSFFALLTPLTLVALGQSFFPFIKSKKLLKEMGITKLRKELKRAQDQLKKSKKQNKDCFEINSKITSLENEIEEAFSKNPDKLNQLRMLNDPIRMLRVIGKSIALMALNVGLTGLISPEMSDFIRDKYRIRRGLSDKSELIIYLGR